jgi:hypothetical protein
MSDVPGFTSFVDTPARGPLMLRRRHDAIVKAARLAIDINQEQRLRERDEYEAQMERDRQERLRVLPDLLAAESRRVAAEIERDQYAQRVEELTEELARLRSESYIFRAVTEPGGRP